MSNFTPENELLQAKQLTFPPIRPLYQKNSEFDQLPEEASFFEDFAEEFDLILQGPSDICLSNILSYFQEPVRG